MQLVMIDGVQVMVDRNASSEAFVHGLDESRSVATIMLCTVCYIVSILVQY